jgi:hypothetical protein
MLGWCFVVYLQESHTGGRLGGVFIFAAYAYGFPFSLSIIASDVGTYTQRDGHEHPSSFSRTVLGISPVLRPCLPERHRIIELVARFAASACVLEFWISWL